MKKLLIYLLEGILDKEKFEVNETESDGVITFDIKTEDKNKGLIIGKGGKMINTLRNILKIPATLQKKAIRLQIAE